MQVSTSVQRWIVVLAAVAIVLFGGVVTLAQASDPIVRYFGFSGDVTIDGVPVEPGTVIVAMVDDEEVGRTTVNQAGAWILDVVMSDLNPDSCAVTFVVDGLRAPEEWPEEGFCGELRLRLALFTDGQERDSASRSTASPGENNQVEAESSSPGEADGENGSLASAEQDDGDQMSADDEGSGDADESRQIVRPSAPSTGTGGVLEHQESTNWPRAVAITALLTFGAALVALLMGRRTNNTH